MVLPILVSAILFYLAFPNIFFLQGFSACAWVFAIPLFMAFEQKNILDRLKIGFLFGLLCNLAVVNWMIPYSFPGYVLLSIILASQAVFFAVLYPAGQGPKFWPILYVPCAWVTSEIFRKFLMMGESWDLGHSQSFDTGFLQIAGLWGSAGISFLLILVNYLFYCIIFRWKKFGHQMTGLITILFLALMIYGYGSAVVPQGPQTRSAGLRICLLQPNTDFHGELTGPRIEQIVNENIALSHEAVKNFKPDLVVWPETSVPTDFWEEDSLKDKIIAMVQKAEVPFLIGGIATDHGGRHNSAILLDSKGFVKMIYDKRHLIPLTEFIPPSWFWKTFAKVFNVDSPQLVPGIGSGMMSITSRTSGVEVRFGVAICSEDNIAEIFREDREQGAGFVAVLLNNGWFTQKEGLVMHAEHSIMHAVENDIPVIRAANTGLSGLIDRYGRLRQGSLDVLGQKAFFQVEVVPRSSPKPNHNFSDTFCFVSLAFVIMNQLWSFFLLRKRKSFPSEILLSSAKNGRGISMKKE